MDGYLYTISCILLTIGSIFLLGLTLRFFIGWKEEMIQKRIEAEKQKQVQPASEV